MTSLLIITNHKIYLTLYLGQICNSVSFLYKFLQESEEFVINSRLRGVNLTEYHLALVEPEKLHTTRRMIYNRVPKCGSVTMWNLMSRVSRKNHFHTVASSIYDPPWVDEEEQKRTVVHVNGLREPFIYNRHLCFLDFPKFGYQMPVYVNLIRHPVDRFVSSYYYQRDLGKKKLTEEEYNVDINGCLERNFTECTLKGTFMLIPFFCGHGKECLQRTRGALGKAKENAVLYYGAVGLTEDFESFLKVLGCVIPHYFEGIDKIYKGKNANKTKDKGAFLTEANAKRLAQHMELEIEFYQFIKDRFYFLKQRLKGKCNV